MNTDDYPTTVAKFRDIFGAYAGARRPATLKGQNFMTDDVLGYVNVNGTTVEVSTGWFLDRRIFGVTFPPAADGTLDDRSQMIDSLEDARAYLMSILSGVRGSGEVLP
jgi:hypothetical protein